MIKENSTLKWRLASELVYLLIAPILYGLMVLPFYNYISPSFHLFFFVGTFIIVQYFRIVVNERAVFWVRSFWAKLILGILNSGFFFVALKEFMYFIDQFEDYNFTGVGMLVRDIYPGLGASAYTLLRSSTYLVGVTGLLLIVMLILRLIYSVFKYREVPGLGDR